MSPSLNLPLSFNMSPDRYTQSPSSLEKLVPTRATSPKSPSLYLLLRLLDAELDAELDAALLEVVAKGLEAARPGGGVGQQLAVGVAPGEAGFVDDENGVALLHKPLLHHGVSLRAACDLIDSVSLPTRTTNYRYHEYRPDHASVRITGIQRWRRVGLKRTFKLGFFGTINRLPW